MEPTPSPGPASGKPELHLGKFAASDLDPSNQPEGATMIIKRAAVETAAQARPAGDPIDPETGLPLSVMLGLITYCYARGVFRSDDIALKLRQEAALKAVFGNKLPDGPTIRRFRRRYSDEIEDTLETLYRELPGQEDADTTTVKRQAAERIHDAAWRDRTSR
jgi:hypothetical protein